MGSSGSEACPYGVVSTGAPFKYSEGLSGPQESGYDACGPLGLEVTVPPRAELRGNKVGEGLTPAQWGEWPSVLPPCALHHRALVLTCLPLCPPCLGSRPHKLSVVLRLSRVHKCLVKIAGEQEYFMLVATPAQAIKSVPTEGRGLRWLSSQALCKPLIRVPTPALQSPRGPFWALP